MTRRNYPRDPVRLSEDIAVLLQHLRENRLLEMTVRQAVGGALWWVSDAHGKRVKCNLWSKGAREAWDLDPRWVKDTFVHEHLVPRTLLEDAILSLKGDPAPQTRIARLLTCSRACIVTVAEDKRLNELKLKQRLPAGAEVQSVMARYHAAKIELDDASQAKVKELLVALRG